MLKKSFSLYTFCSRRLLSLQKADKKDWKEQEKILMEPFEYIQKVRCKHHQLMAPTFNHWLQVPADTLDKIQEAIQTLVSWTVLLDDIQDESPFRYGVPAAHKVFGAGLTINAASKALLLGQKQIMELGHPLGPQVFWNRMEEYLHGQGSDIYWRDNYLCPTEEAHIEMTKNKSGAFFAFPVDLMQLFSSTDKDYTELASDIGVYFHILDDYYNLFEPKGLQLLADEKHDNYGTCSDITESKITLAIIHASQFPDVASELADILKQRTSDPKLQNRVITLLKKHGSDEYMRDTLSTMEADIRAQIDQLNGNPILTAFMDDLSFQKKYPERNLHVY